MSFEVLTGPFAGAVVEEGTNFIIGLCFDELDVDMQSRVRQFAQDNGIEDLDDAVELYELSWDSVEV